MEMLVTGKEAWAAKRTKMDRKGYFVVTVYSNEQCAKKMEL